MYVEQTDSTNSLMQRLLRGEEQNYAACLDEKIPTLYTTYQTAGRGQTGNSWESEPGKNLLLTYLLREPEVKITEQFMLNVIAAVAAHRTIAPLLSYEQRAMLTIKWPNDIYIGNKKIAGILVENSLSGSKILHSIAGIGINLNQDKWLSDAPNPVSIKQLTGVKVDIDTVVQSFVKNLKSTLGWEPQQQRNYYRVHFYRRDGFWPFVEREVSTQPTVNASPGTQGQFMARFKEILPTGQIVLIDQDGNLRTYHFKQIRYVV